MPGTARPNARVLAGEWSPGQALPSEQALAAQHGVAMATLRRSLDLLASQGFIERIEAYAIKAAREARSW